MYQYLGSQFSCRHGYYCDKCDYRFLCFAGEVVKINEKQFNDFYSKLKKNGRYEYLGTVMKLFLIKKKIK
jgi:hypothetical protein